MRSTPTARRHTVANRTRQSKWADTPAEIKGRRTMDVTLLSGAKVTLRTVDLDELALAEALPGDLLAAAILDSAGLLLPQMLQDVRAGKTEDAQKLSRDTVALRDRVVRAALVAPEATDEVVDALDAFDKRMIVELAQRRLTQDAAGKVVAAQSLGDFEQFREVGDGDEAGAADRTERVEAVVG